MIDLADPRQAIVDGLVVLLLDALEDEPRADATPDYADYAEKRAS